MKTDDVRINDRRYDRRCKLSEQQREEILQLKEDASASVRSTAKKFGVSRRTIQFMWYPERREKNKADTKKLNLDSTVESRYNRKLIMRKHRAYKRRLANRRLVELPVSALYHEREYVWAFKSHFGMAPVYIDKEDGSTVRIISIIEKLNR